MSNTKRLLVYIVPVTVLSFALNIPKFMEVTLTQNNGTNEVDPSQTRRDPTFIFWYTLSLIWHPTLTTGVLPFIGLVYMNMQIFIGIRQSRQVGDLLRLVIYIWVSGCRVGILFDEWCKNRWNQELRVHLDYTRFFI